MYLSYYPIQSFVGLALQIFCVTNSNIDADGSSSPDPPGVIMCLLLSSANVLNNAPATAPNGPNAQTDPGALNASLVPVNRGLAECLTHLDDY